MKDHNHVEGKSILRALSVIYALHPAEYSVILRSYDVTDFTYVLEYGNSGQNADDCWVVGSSRMPCSEGCLHR